MKEYPKIQSVFKRDDKTHKFIIGEWAEPEFEYLKDCLWEATEKIDGTNIRVIWDEAGRRFEGRTDNAQIPAILYKKLCETFPTDNPFDYPVCLYGEGYGTRIQKGGGNYKADGVDFALFDVFIDGWWLEQDNVKGIAEKLGISAVPFVGYFTLHNAMDFVDTGFKSTFGDFNAEGLVLKTQVQLFNRKGKRIITKMKTKDF